MVPPNDGENVLANLRSVASTNELGEESVKKRLAGVETKISVLIYKVEVLNKLVCRSNEDSS